MMDLLYRLQKDRWTWAKRGVEEFRNGFLRLRKLDNEKNRVMIGVYGATQVGKTTLILKILGIQEEKIRELSNSLRGKRLMGSSATVTTTIYQRSFNDKFTVNYPDGTSSVCDTLIQLEELMSNIRLRVENKEYNSHKPLVIQISNLFFNFKELENRKQEIEILDLPGDNSKNKREMEHVIHCLKEYLPQCRVCILVENAERMISLTQIDREYVRDWRELPNNFRIVFTRSATSSSIMRNIREKKINSKETFRQAIVGPFHFYLNEAAKNINIYPLEYGDSWQGLMQMKSEVYKRAKPWIEEIFRELYDDLCTAVSPENEILQMKYLENLIIKKSEDELRALEESRNQLLNEKVEIEDSLLKKKKLITSFQEEKVNILKVKEDIEKKAQLSYFIIEEITSWAERSFDERKVSALRNEICYISDKINDYYDEKASDNYNKLNGIAKKYNLKIKPITHTKNDIELFLFFLPKLINIYFFQNDFEVDYKKYMQALININEKGYWNLEKNIEDCKKDLLDKLDGLCVILEDHISIYDKEIKKLNKDIEKNRLLIVDIGNEIQIASREWEKDRERSRQLNLFLKRAFIKQSLYFKKMVLHSDTNSKERWIYHQFWNITAMDAERISIHE